MKNMYLVIALLAAGLYAMEELPADEGRMVPAQGTAKLAIENRSGQNLTIAIAGREGHVVASTGTTLISMPRGHTPVTISKTVCDTPHQLVLYETTVCGSEYPLVAVPFRANTMVIPWQLKPSKITVFRAHAPAK